MIDLNKYIFRQKVLELIYNYENIKKETLQIVLKNIDNYMNKYNLKEEPLLISLHDDIVITLNTMNTSIGKMYSTARFNSNSKQLTYNVSVLPRNLFKSRNNIFDISNHTNSECQILNNQPLSQNYSTPRQLEIMRSCSNKSFNKL